MQKFQDHVPQKRIVGDQPVNKPIAGRQSEMILNNDGAFTFEAPILKQVERFLILGTSGGTYYVSEKKLTKDNVSSLEHALKDFPTETIDLIVNISDEGRCLKNETCVFALAFASSNENLATRKYALSKLEKVCRIGTHLFAFVEYAKYFRGRGRLFTDALKNWYLNKEPGKLAYQLVKYQQRNGWSHKDVLRLCKPTPPNADVNAAFRWAAGKGTNEHTLALKAITGFERAKMPNSVQSMKELIAQYGLTREMIPTQYLKDPEIWSELIKNTKYEALIRNLGVLTANGYLKPLSENVDYVVSRIIGVEEIAPSRIHPIQLIMAYFTYKSGHGTKGQLAWEPNRHIVAALEEAFYKSFSYVEPTGKKYLLGIDVSSSMTWNNIGGLPGFVPRVAAAVMAMVTVRAEKRTHIIGFCDTIEELAIDKNMSLNEVTNVINQTRMGSTNIGLQIQYAIQHKLDVDVFVCYTDNEVNQGSHVSTLLNKYRATMGKPKAALCVVAMEATRCTIADPNDQYMLDFVGFDSSTPAAINGFVSTI